MKSNRNNFFALSLLLFSAALGVTASPQAANAQTSDRGIQIVFEGEVGFNAYRREDKQVMSVQSSDPDSFEIFGSEQDYRLGYLAKVVRIDLLEPDAGEISESCREMLNDHITAVRTVSALGQEYQGRVMISGTTNSVKWNKSLRLLEIKLRRLEWCSRS